MKEAISQENKTVRRNFLKKGLLTGSIIATGALGLEKAFAGEKESAEKVKVLTPDGKVYETCAQ